jgi:hypothetical protein
MPLHDEEPEYEQMEGKGQADEKDKFFPEFLGQRLDGFQNIL